MSRCEQGFTLLEIMLAITMLGVVMAMLSLSLSGAARVIEGTEQQESIYHQAQIAMRRITEDLAATLQQSEVAFTGTKVDSKSQRADTLVFASQARLVFNNEQQKPGLAKVRYRVEADPDDPRRLKLLRSDTLLLPGVEYSKGDSEERAFLLADDLRAISFRYLDYNGQEFDSWTEEQDSDGQNEARPLPAGVVCTLEFWLDPDKETSLTFSTGALLPAAPILKEESGGG